MFRALFMYTLDFKQPIHVYFMGIGGISMSALAEILLDAGFPISGSDAKKSPLTEHLSSIGAKISYSQRAENITDDMTGNGNNNNNNNTNTDNNMNR